MSVTAELAQQRLGVPEQQMWFVGPGERCMSGEQRPPLQPLARHERGAAQRFGSRCEFGGVEQLRAEGAAQ